MDLQETFGVSTPIQHEAPSTEVVAPNFSLINNTHNEVSPVDIIADNDIGIASLSVQQLERCYYLSTFYGEETSIRIVKMLVPSGVNTWSSVCNKITALTNPDPDTAKYMGWIKKAIRMDQEYTLASIIKVISAIRKGLGLKPYLKNIIKDCVNDFLSGHIAEVVLSDKVDPKTDKRPVIAYKPVIDLSFTTN